MKLFPFFSAALLLCLTACQTEPVKKKKTVRQPPVPGVGGAAAVTPSVSPSGVVTTASGLQYRVLASGPTYGRSPSYSDSVSVHYHGTLADGTVFDSSIERGQPATFGVGQVIPGWTEALQLMKPGDKWLLLIPARLAYGNRAVGGKIPPNSDLIFQVELLEVVGR
ncbi:MAG: FKBP-type peptidyl-prolyl cis-trans isomerase [Verrucomicrobiota bacterium]